MASKIIGSTSEVESGKIIEDTSLSIKVSNKTDEHIQAVDASDTTVIASAEAVQPTKEAYVSDDSYPTVFVRNIAQNVTDDELRIAFTRYGAVEKAVVVRNTRNGTNRGFGFVHFAAMDAVDAAIADSDPPVLRDARVRIELADKKNVLYCGRIPPALNEDEVRAQIERITGLPLLRFELCVHASGRSRCYGWARFADHDAALQALEKLDKTPFASTKPNAENLTPAATVNDKPLRVRMAEPRVVDPRVMKTIRALYVKNINPECKSEEIRKAFGGTCVKRVFIPLQKRTRKPLGTAVIHYKQRKSAEEYLTRMDGAELHGRKLHVEWCLPEESLMSHSAKIKAQKQCEQKQQSVKASEVKPEAAAVAAAETGSLASPPEPSSSASVEPMYAIPVGYRSPLFVPMAAMSWTGPADFGRNKKKKQQQEQIQMPVEKPPQETQLLPIYGYFFYPPPQMPLYPVFPTQDGMTTQPAIPRRSGYSHRKKDKKQGSSSSSHSTAKKL